MKDYGDLYAKMDQPLAAFPAAIAVGPSGDIYTEEGMTLRDYFAAKAMGGICSASDECGRLLQHGYEWIATESYRVADAMLKARTT